MIIENFYQTKIECIKDGDDSLYYNVNIDATDIRIEVSLIDFNGNPVIGKDVTLSVDRGTITSIKSGYTGTIASGGKSVTGTTGADGKFAVLYTASEWGLATFTVNNTSTQINVTGFRTIYNSNGLRISADENAQLTHVDFNRNITVSAKGVITILSSETIAEKYCPSTTSIHYLQNTASIHYLVVRYLGEMQIYSELARTNNNCQFNILYRNKC